MPRAVPTVTFGTAPSPSYLGGSFTVNASTTNTDSHALTYSVVSGPCVFISSNGSTSATFNSTGVGTCVVQAYGAATTNFEAAWATQSIPIGLANQAALTVVSTPATVVQGYTSRIEHHLAAVRGETVTYSVGSSSGCNIDSVILNQLDVTNSSGSCNVTAQMAGNGSYNPVTSTPLAVPMAPYELEINKSFSPINITPGGTSTLSITIYNSNYFPLTSAAWSDNLVGVQPGISVASPVSLTNTCGGNVGDISGGSTLVPGDTKIFLSGGTVPAQVGQTNGSCTVTINVTSTTAGNLVNTIPAGSSTATGTGGGQAANTTSASATLQVSTVLPPSVNKNFNLATIWAGAASQLTINIVGTDPNNALTQLNLTDALPGSVVIANPAAASTTNCGSPTLTATPGATSVSLSNATLAAGVGTTCTIKLNVTSSTQGTYTDVIPAGAIQTLQGVTNAALAPAPLNVQQLNLTKVFAPAAIPAGGTSTATITLQNPTSFPYTGVGLTDNLPGGMLVSGTPNPSQCGGGTVSSTTTSVTLAGGTIPAGTPGVPGTCTLVFVVTTSPNQATGNLTNTIPAGSLTDNQGISNPVAVSTNLAITSGLTVTKAIAPSPVQPGNPSTVTITLSNSTAAALTGVSMTDSLPSLLTVYGTPATSQCGGTITYTTTSVTLTGGTVPLAPVPPTTPGTCTVTFQVTSTVQNTYTNSIPSGSGGVCGYQGAVQICNTAVANANIVINANLLPVTGTKTFTPSGMLPTQTAT